MTLNRNAMQHEGASRHGIILQGMLELFVLGECSRGSVSGKGITDRVEKFTGGFWRPSPGSIYPVLKRLEGKGALRAKLEERKAQGSGKREINYQTTAAGKAMLQDGRKCMSTEFDETLNAVNPLFFRIMYGFEDEEIEELNRFMLKLTEFKKHFALIPYEVRSPRRKAFFEAIEKEIDKLRAMKT
ncbi:MAG: PadR family transcriptional regulator [Candidatus Micrarchaeota archaeon]